MQAEIIVKGIVQGVGFRPFIYRIAVANRLCGYVQNRDDASVRIIVEGEGSDIQNFLFQLKERRPPLAEIYDLKVTYRNVEKSYSKFEIVNSSKDGYERGSTIPPDISICGQCLSEMRNPTDRRYRYFFITCTDCGPRYTIIRNLPYDRCNTSMHHFRMCIECEREYFDPKDRRFHSQTNACPICGPQLILVNNRGDPLTSNDPAAEAGHLIDEGYILAVKGNGGFHLACSTTTSKPLMRLRTVKDRKSKPFAIMARDLETIKTFAHVSDLEASILESYQKPIVLLRKSEDYFLSEMISPGLHTIGVMLPYTGLHYLLFDYTKEPALVMTSANPPNEPIIIDEHVAMKKLAGIADYFLIHSREIVQRCDDSVLRIIDGRKVFIRRSRGYAPTPIILKRPTEMCVLSLGAELNVTCCIINRERAYISQHIGDVETLDTLEHLGDTVRHMLSLTKSSPEVIACDLHPKFTTTDFAKRLSTQLDIPLIQIQHHHAHLSKLMVEHGVDEAVGIVCDGYGYGSDGKAWGGEILYSNMGDFERLGHLQEQPMVGGDLSARYPLRIAAGILYGHTDIQTLLMRQVRHLPHGVKEVEIIMKQLQSGRVPVTTSCGRVLDAVSSILGVCYERTYEGEPAMKLESIAIQGRDVLKLEPVIEGCTINTSHLLEEVYSNLGKFRIADLASSAESYLARSLAELAVRVAVTEGVSVVGFTGGVACNEHMHKIIKTTIEGNNLRFVSHDTIPPGDGGVSLGQAAAAAMKYGR
ncbi:MAG: carbamoyltransferase HypF [Candidatus Bathyarchaeia archaeon]